MALNPLDEDTEVLDPGFAHPRGDTDNLIELMRRVREDIHRADVRMRNQRLGERIARIETDILELKLMLRRRWWQFWR